MEKVVHKERGRDVSFDLVKAIAMFMVVYWHVMSYRAGFNLETMPSYASNFIVALNMPLFFMVSGYFSKRLHEGGDWRRVLDRFVFYFWPMAFFAVLFTCIDSIVLGRFQILQIPLKAIKTFLFADWFFHSLAICDGITFLAYKCDKPWKKLLVCTLGYAVCLIGTGRLWYVGCVVNMISFYWFGFLLLPKILNRRRLFSAMAILGGGALIWVTYFYGNVATNGMSFYWDRLDVFHPQFEKALNMVMRFVVGTLGSLSVIWLLKLVSDRVSWCARLAFLGRETLGIYFLQGWLITNCVVPFIGLGTGTSILLFASMIVFLMTFLIIEVLKANEFIGRAIFGWRIFQSTRCKLQVSELK